MFKNKEVIHMVAVDENMGIGKDNKLLYSIPNDIKYFRDTTLGHSLLCGRNTYDGFPKPLDRRIVRCITRNGGESSNDILVDGLYDAVHNSHLLNTDKIFIVGGASLYEQTADIVDTLLITEIKSSDKEADTFYNIPDGFIKVRESDTQHSVNGLSFKFTKWEREVLNEVFKRYKL